MDNLTNEQLQIIAKILEYSQIIESLTAQRELCEENSADWITIEKKIIEFECELFNEVITINLMFTFSLMEKMPIIALMGLHLHSLMNKPEYSQILIRLTETSKMVLDLIWETLQEQKKGKK
jgi:predicted secreted protein